MRIGDCDGEPRRMSGAAAARSARWDENRLGKVEQLPGNRDFPKRAALACAGCAALRYRVMRDDLKCACWNPGPERDLDEVIWDSFGPDWDPVGSRLGPLWDPHFTAFQDADFDETYCSSDTYNSGDGLAGPITSFFRLPLDDRDVVTLRSRSKSEADQMRVERMQAAMD